jgi:hypothetical protein
LIATRESISRELIPEKVQGMPRYDFKSLSPQDFEELIRDLLQAEWDVALEAFRSGRDDGIDLRYASVNAGATIIQCKHYATSGFDKLLATLRADELPKIKRLAPTRYVVATSVSLTPKTKAKIVTALQPFVLSVQDILGANDIEGLLIRHPEVERANFKLWLTSTRVLERVLHNATLCQTDFKVERLRRKIPLFVKSDAYPRATAILNQTRIVVVTGPPGIGKTTLAEMLLYSHLEDGYEPVAIEADITEGKELFRSEEKQIFYYDDFLGQTFLGDRREYLGRNQDSAIVDFMEMVRQSSKSRFILTTREHILRGALQFSERLAHSPILDHHCILELSDYSYGIRARLLYNHLYFSDLPQTYKEELLKEDFFLDIIKHEHFNPRLIEWLSAYSRLGHVPTHSYRAHVADLLQAPEKIWAHAFNSQISDAARHVLLSFNTLGEWTDTVDLEPAFIALHRYSAAKYHQQIRVGEFRRALQELEGAFLSYRERHASYLNPSVRDFVASVITTQREVAEDLLNSAVRFKQVVNLWELSAAHPCSELRSLLTTNVDLLCSSLSGLLEGPSIRWVKKSDGTRIGYFVDMDYEGKVEFLAKIAAAHQSVTLCAMASRMAMRLIEKWKKEIVEFGPVLRLLEAIAENRWFLDHGGREVYRSLLTEVVDALGYARAEEWLNILEFQTKAIEWSDADEEKLKTAFQHYKQSGVDDERRDCTSTPEMTGLRESLSKLSAEYGLDFEYAIERLDEDIAERGEEHPHEGGSGYSRDQTPPLHDLVTDDQVREMFRTLREGG